MHKAQKIFQNQTLSLCVMDAKPKPFGIYGTHQHHGQSLPSTFQSIPSTKLWQTWLLKSHPIFPCHVLLSNQITAYKSLPHKFYFSTLLLKDKQLKQNLLLAFAPLLWVSRTGSLSTSIWMEIISMTREKNGNGAILSMRIKETAQKSKNNLLEQAKCKNRHLLFLV